MKVLVTGTSGQLGHDVMLDLISRGYDGLGDDRLRRRIQRPLHD